MDNREFLRICADGSTPERTAAVPGRILQVDVRFERAGAWSGVSELLEQAFQDFERRGLRDAIDAHNYELHMALPRRRAEIPLKYACLTDAAIGAERTRNFPLDRAYRIVNGLVSFVQRWKALYPHESWAVVARNFSLAQHLASRFFIELGRRSSGRGIAVYVEVASDAASAGMAARGASAHEAGSELSYLDLAPLPPADAASRQPASATDGGMEWWEEAYPALLAACRQRGAELETARVALRAMCLYNHYGYYYESASFAPSVLPYFQELVGDDEEARWNYVGNIFQGLVTTGQEHMALRMIEEHAMPCLTRPALRAKMHYLLAMMYARYLKPHDIPAAEQHILAAVAAIEAAKPAVAPEEYAFLSVFINNGLAFIRVRQSRLQEALQLCESGFEFLGTQLAQDQHRLHRSVLLYNCAQVYVMLADHERALAAYQQAIAMDPYYSEYYNELGNILQQLERYDAALDNYEKAVRYSAPYAEVYYNIALCQSRVGELQSALESLARSEELNPLQPELHCVRGEIADELGDAELAYAAYSRALELAPDLVAARVNRAVLGFGRGELQQALADMNHAIAVEPDEPAHYQNRAAIHATSGQVELAQADLACSQRLQAAPAAFAGAQSALA